MIAEDPGSLKTRAGQKISGSRIAHHHEQLARKLEMEMSALRPWSMKPGTHSGEMQSSSPVPFGQRESGAGRASR